MAFRGLWNMFSEKTPRDKDTAAFLLEAQRGFYQDQVKYVHSLGYKGLVTASNWVTASPEVFGPIEKYSYTVGDFLDRHGYFGCDEKGDNAEWSMRDGHTYIDRSALKFEAEEPGKPRQFVHPVMDVHYDGKPSMISETTFCRPNRYRSEAPLFYAAYGALQHSDAIVHFALDSRTWAVKPNFFMQPWTLMTPAMMGQFPAAALIFRQRLVAAGDVLVDLNLKVQDVLDLQGHPPAPGRLVRRTATEGCARRRRRHQAGQRDRPAGALGGADRRAGSPPTAGRRRSRTSRPTSTARPRPCGAPRASCGSITARASW